MCFNDAWQLCQFITEQFKHLDAGTYRIGNGEWVVRLYTIDYWLWCKGDWTLYLLLGITNEEEQTDE